MRWQALVLAGSRRASDPVAQAAGVDHKAFAPLLGRPMISYVLEILAASPMIGEIFVSIEKSAGALPPGVEATRVDAGPSPAQSVHAAFRKTGAPCLVTTADNPLLTAAMLSDFMAGADRANTDVAAAIAERSIVEQAGNPGRRTYLKFRDGAYSGCNLFILRTDAAGSAVEFWMRLETDRKKPWRMARQLGFGPLLGYLTGRLTTDSAAHAIADRAGCTAALVKLDHPDAAHDVDKPDDLDFVSRRIAARARSGGLDTAP